MRRRLPGYATTTPDILQRRFLQTSGEILNQGDETPCLQGKSRWRRLFPWLAIGGQHPDAKIGANAW